MNKTVFGLITYLLSVLIAHGQKLPVSGDYRVYRLEVEYSNGETLERTPLEARKVKMLLTADYTSVYLYETNKSEELVHHHVVDVDVSTCIRQINL